MIANLLWIPVLFLIIWSTGRFTSVETPVYVSEDVYETISQQLNSHRPTVTAQERAKTQYQYYHAVRAVGNSEVCQWGILANELNEPTYNICVIVAVALKERNDLRQTASSSSSPGMSGSSSYSDYDCPKLPVANMAEFEQHEETGLVAQRVLVCPRISINDPSTHERITFERFLIADGDYDQNSIFVFGFSDDSFRELSLKLYITDIFKIIKMKVSSKSVDDFRSVVRNLQRNIELNELCNSSIKERQNVCKYSAMRRFSDGDEKMVLLGKDFDFDATHLDTSGFVPYRCFKRVSAPQVPVTQFVGIRYGFGEPVDHIYCPAQVIRIGDSVMTQSGFFYSISRDMYEKRIHIKQIIAPLIFRDTNKVYEKTVLPFPMLE